MPRKRRVEKMQREAISQVALYASSDGLYGVADPADEEAIVRYQYPTLEFAESHRTWLAVREYVLPGWIRERPGTRPSWWWWFDPSCPRVDASLAHSLRWPQKAFFLAY